MLFAVSEELIKMEITGRIYKKFCSFGTVNIIPYVLINLERVTPTHLGNLVVPSKAPDSAVNMGVSFDSSVLLNGCTVTEHRHPRWRVSLSHKLAEVVFWVSTPKCYMSSSCRSPVLSHSVLLPGVWPLFMLMYRPRVSCDYSNVSDVWLDVFFGYSASVGNVGKESRVLSWQMRVKTVHTGRGWDSCEAWHSPCLG